MDYVAVYNDSIGPAQWAVDREAEGWWGVAMADHISYGGRGWWHPFSALGAMAASTERVMLTTAYGNNLMRSPVEFAQAALSLHGLSAGRYEVGLGAGWAETEIVGAGLDYPDARVRAERLREAIAIVRDLLRGGCQFAGDHYTIDLETAGPPADPPPTLTAALGGPWTTKHIAPLVDRIEIAPMGAALRGGDLDPVILAATTKDQVRSLVDRARQANPTAQIGLSVFVAVGDSPMVAARNAGFGDGFASGLAGSPAQVAEAVAALEEYEIDRITIVPPVPDTIALLAPELLGS